MIKSVVTVILLVVSAFVDSAQAMLVDSSTVRVNYYKNLYLSESRRLIECHGLALLASAASNSCNASDSDLDVSDHCPGRASAGAKIRPLVDTQMPSIVRTETRNLSHEDDLTITLGNVTVLRQKQEPEGNNQQQHSIDEEGK